MITLHNPMDMHLHLREGDMLTCVLPFSAEYFSACVIMPNLKIPIKTSKQAIMYKNEILSNTNAPFMPLMSLYFHTDLDKNELLNAKNNGIRILKLYPKGVTTGSQSGVSQILCQDTLNVLEIAQNLDFILSIHCESDGFCMQREYEFLSILEQIGRDFPRLHIIIEHISDYRSLEILEKYDNMFGTLTLHHISFNLNDMLGNALQSHLFCKPILKSKKDQEALLNAALNAHRKISFGSDSAPHLINDKYAGAAGVFSAPVALNALVEIFSKYNALDNLQAFVSDNAITNYQLKDFPKKRVVIGRGDFNVPQAITCKSGDIIPLYAGEKLQWRIKNVIKE